MTHSKALVHFGVAFCAVPVVDCLLVAGLMSLLAGTGCQDERLGVMNDVADMESSEYDKVVPSRFADFDAPDSRNPVDAETIVDVGRPEVSLRFETGERLEGDIVGLGETPFHFSGEWEFQYPNSPDNCCDCSKCLCGHLVLEADPAGVLYVVERACGRIKKISPKGDLLAVWGDEGGGSEPGDLVWPHDIAPHPDGLVFVGEAEPECVTGFDPDGNVEVSWPLPVCDEIMADPCPQHIIAPAVSAGHLLVLPSIRTNWGLWRFDLSGVLLDINYDFCSPFCMGLPPNGDESPSSVISFQVGTAGTYFAYYVVTVEPFETMEYRLVHHLADGEPIEWIALPSLFEWAAPMGCTILDGSDGHKVRGYHDVVVVEEGVLHVVQSLNPDWNCLAVLDASLDMIGYLNLPIAEECDPPIAEGTICQVSDFLLTKNRLYLADGVSSKILVYEH